jgi:hypothetical protein
MFCTHGRSESAHMLRSHYVTCFLLPVVLAVVAALCCRRIALVYTDLPHPWSALRDVMLTASGTQPGCTVPPLSRGWLALAMARSNTGACRLSAFASAHLRAIAPAPRTLPPTLLHTLQPAAVVIDGAQPAALGRLRRHPFRGRSARVARHRPPAHACCRTSRVTGRSSAQDRSGTYTKVRCGGGRRAARVAESAQRTTLASTSP